LMCSKTTVNKKQMIQAKRSMHTYGLPFHSNTSLLILQNSILELKFQKILRRQILHSLLKLPSKLNTIHFRSFKKRLINMFQFYTKRILVIGELEHLNR
uniref:Ovule protein n=1 Tax=Brugia timori TaxID=42155 RepID=A0A0R3Q3B7_9BILA